MPAMPTMNHPGGSGGRRARLTRAPVRIPAPEEYRAFNGPHCHRLWRQHGEDWQCPGCGRTKFELMAWGERKRGNAERSRMKSTAPEWCCANEQSPPQLDYVVIW